MTLVVPRPASSSAPPSSSSRGGADFDVPAAVVVATPRGPSPRGRTLDHAPAAIDLPLPELSAPRVHGSLAEATLRILAENHSAFERTRIETENRLRSLRQVYGIPEGADLPEIRRLQSALDGLLVLEHAAELDLKRSLRAHPLGAWVKATVGIGEKQGARLIAAIGDPYWNSLHDRPRTVSELWAYCGYHVLRPVQESSDNHTVLDGADKLSDPGQQTSGPHIRSAGVAARRRKGQKANWNADAKMRAHLCATSCIKQATSPYRAAYDNRRSLTAATHPDWTAGHSHNDGLRIVAKAILRDLWREARKAAA